MTILQLGISLLIAYFSWRIMVNVCHVNKFTQPTALGVAYISFVCMHYIPSIFFLADETLIHSRDYFWASTVALVLLGIGGWCANIVLHFRPKTLADYYRQIDSAFLPTREKTFIFGFSVLCFIIFALYVVQVPVYPLLLLITGRADTAEINVMRSQVIGPQMASSLWYVYSVGRAFIMPMLFALVFAIWPSLKTGIEKAWAISAFIMVFIFNSWSSAKTPVAMLFAIIAIIAIMRIHRVSAVKRSRVSSRNNRRKVFFVVGFFLLLAATYPIYIFKLKTFGQDRGILEIFYEGVFKRIVFKPALGTYFQFEMFPYMFDFTYFRDIYKLAIVLGLEPVNLSTLTASVLFGADSNAPPATIGNFYAQAGWPAIIGGFFLIGVLLQTAQVYLVRLIPKNPVGLAYLSVLCYGGFRFSMTDFYNVFLSETIVPLIVLLVARRFLGGIRTRSVSRPQPGRINGLAPRVENIGVHGNPGQGRLPGSQSQTL